MRKFRPYKKPKTNVLLMSHTKAPPSGLDSNWYRLQDPVEATHPLHHPGLLLGHKQNHGVHGQVGRPPLLGCRDPEPRPAPLALLQGHNNKCHFMQTFSILNS